MNAKNIIARLNLVPHPEGGWFRQTWIAGADGNARLLVQQSIIYLRRVSVLTGTG